MGRRSASLDSHVNTDLIPRATIQRPVGIFRLVCITYHLGGCRRNRHDNRSLTVAAPAGRRPFWSRAREQAVYREVAIIDSPCRPGDEPRPQNSYASRDHHGAYLHDPLREFVSVAGGDSEPRTQVKGPALGARRLIPSFDPSLAFWALNLFSGFSRGALSGRLGFQRDDQALPERR